MTQSDLESALRHSIEAQVVCPICYDRLQTPVIAPCSHTFCSICIRNWLKVSKRCAVCSKTVEPSNLVSDRVLERILSLLAASSDSGLTQPVRTLSLDSGKDQAAKRHRISSQADLTLVERTRERLPVVSLSIATDKALRGHLARYGLNSRGSRPQLDSRWSEFTVLFEANQDRDNPLPLSQVVRMVEQRENARNQSNQPNRVTSLLLPKSETFGLGDNSFRTLIAQTQKENKKRKLSESMRDETNDNSAINASCCDQTTINMSSSGNTINKPQSDKCLVDLPPPWRTVWSEVYERPLYYNCDTKEGTFRCPVVMGDVNCSQSLLNDANQH